MDLSGIPFLDGHLHPPLAAPPADVADLRRRWYEGPAETADAVTSMVAYLDSLRRLGLAYGTGPDEAALVARIAATPPAGRLAQVMAEGHIDALVVDEGFPPPDRVLAPEAIAAAAGGRVCRLIRLETEALALFAAEEDFDRFVEAFRARVAGAPAAGYGGLKSIIGYRSGLAVAPSDAEAARAGFAREKRAGARRLTDKALLDHLLIAALEENRRMRLPIQFHCGYGDADVDATLCNPLGLRWLIESGQAAGFPVVLLHGAWPHTKAASWMAAVHAHVVLDIASCIPPIGWTGVQAMLRDALAVAPMRQIQMSSDAPTLADQILIAAEVARETLGEVLGELHARKALSAAQCEAAAEDILWRNGRRIYWGEGMA